MVRAFFSLTKQAALRWVDDECYRLGAALAYYGLYSLFPLLLLSVAGLGFLLGHGDLQRERLVEALPVQTPEARAVLEQTLVSLQSHSTARGWGTVAGVLTLVFGASGVFSELESSLDRIWRFKPQENRSVWPTVLSAAKAKALSFAAVLAAAIVVLASLVLSTVLAAIGHDIRGAFTIVWRVVEILVSVTFVTLLVAAIFRLVPHVRSRWRDVLGGALFAAVLLGVLKAGFAWYLAHLGDYAAYGVVGAVLGLLTWIYAASLVLFFGAEFARAYAERYGALAG
ncbi:MAG: YihY/virulence factor BrkB family protein [Polyangiaceae bacterium]